MSDKRILLVCAAGMSTSLLVTKMQEAAKNQGKDYDIWAISAQELDATLSQKHPDVVLLGPQVRYMEAEIKPKVQATGAPLSTIDMRDYGMMNGANVLAYAEKLIG